jgi:hypothetical protein
LEQPVASDVGDEEVCIIQDFDETGLAPLGRGIATALGIAGREYQERGLPDKVLD